MSLHQTFVKVNSGTDDRRLIARFEVRGTPKSHSFRLDKGRPNRQLRAWQEAVRQAAQKAMKGRPPFLGPVVVSMIFEGKAMNSEPDGSPWTTPIRPDGSKQDRQVPDLDNLNKATLDALQKLVIGDDVQVAKIASHKRHGLLPRVVIEDWSL